MIDALFPPSSRLTRLTRAAAAAWIALPVGTEPVNVTASTPGALTSAAPTASPAPWTTLNTPGGMPASRASSAIRTAVIGVCSAGLSTTLLPAHSGKIPIDAPAVGPFQGIIAPITPIGSRTW